MPFTYGPIPREIDGPVVGAYEWASPNGVTLGVQRIRGCAWRRCDLSLGADPSAAARDYLVGPGLDDGEAGQISVPVRHVGARLAGCVTGDEPPAMTTSGRIRRLT
ncbi:MAG: hypothetical protein WBG41_00540 [Acidimicrobiales bacterium]